MTASLSNTSPSTASSIANRRIVLVTGGSRGLGRNTAEHLARQGLDVVLTYRERADQAQAAVAAIEALGGRAAALQLDVARSAGFADFAARVRRALAEPPLKARTRVSAKMPNPAETMARMNATTPYVTSSL